MSPALRQNTPFLQYLVQTASSKQKKLLLQSVTTCQLKALTEIVRNVLRTDFPLTRTLYQRIVRYKTQIRQFADSKTSIKRQKEILQQGYLWILLIVQASLPLWSTR